MRSEDPEEISGTVNSPEASDEDKVEKSQFKASVSIFGIGLEPVPSIK